MIRNYIISTVLVICVFMLSGCRLANMDDVNAMSSNNAIETTKQVQSEKIQINGVSILNILKYLRT